MIFYQIYNNHLIFLLSWLRVTFITSINGINEGILQSSISISEKIIHLKMGES